MNGITDADIKNLLDTFNRLIPESKRVKLIHRKGDGYDALDLGYTDSTAIKRTIATGLTKLELCQYISAMVEGVDLTLNDGVKE